jgi:hypothetical protein
VTELETDRPLMREFLFSDLEGFRQQVQSKHHCCSTPDERPTALRVEDLIKHFLLTQTNDPRTESHLIAVDKFSNEFVGAVDLCTFAPWRRRQLDSEIAGTCSRPNDLWKGRVHQPSQTDPSQASRGRSAGAG